MIMIIIIQKNSNLQHLGQQEGMSTSIHDLIDNTIDLSVITGKESTYQKRLNQMSMSPQQRFAQALYHVTLDESFLNIKDSELRNLLDTIYKLPYPDTKNPIAYTFAYYVYDSSQPYNVNNKQLKSITAMFNKGTKGNKGKQKGKYADDVNLSDIIRYVQLLHKIKNS